MCFSAEASFTISAVLLLTGVVSLKKITKAPQIIFASIPILFSIQQFSEGVLWIALQDPVYTEWQWEAAYIFLIFAQVLWPVWVPLAFFLLEKEVRRRKIVSVLFGMGGMLSVYHIYCLFYYKVNYQIVGHHIHYDLLFPDYLKWLTRVFYFLPIILSPFLSSIKKARFLGFLNLISFIASLLFFKDNIISVWCFFAAGISAVVLIVMHSEHKTAKAS